MRTRVLSFTMLAAAMAIGACALDAVAATRFARNEGADSAGCGGANQPCRSINAAIRSAVDGDRIVVGAGRYGDLNGNGVTDPGDEGFAGTCTCMVLVDKRITLESEDGAAATIIDGAGGEVMIIRVATDGAVVGKPGKGFTLTGGNWGLSTVTMTGGLVNETTIGGNHAVNNRFAGFVVSGTGHRVTRNLATGNPSGFTLLGHAQVVSNNTATGNEVGFEVLGDHLVVSGNLATGNGMGFVLTSGPHTFTGNSAIGNEGPGIRIDFLAPSVITRNNIFGNDVTENCGVRTSQSGTLAARGNFWGSPAGPGADPADLACDEDTSATITSSPAARAFPVGGPTLQ